MDIAIDNHRFYVVIFPSRFAQKAESGNTRSSHGKYSPPTAGKPAIFFRIDLLYLTK
jgi:hypothetical protein